MLVGMCHLCPRPGVSNCFQCGLATCMVHLDPNRQLCESCRAGRRAGTTARRT